MSHHGHFHWNELMTFDAESAKAFYGTVAGWTFQGMNMPEGGTYWVCMNGDQHVAGIFTMEGPEFEGMTPQWMAYLSVDDVDACVKQAESAGGKLIKPADDIPGVGRIAMVQDPTGAVLGWVTPTPDD